MIGLSTNEDLKFIEFFKIVQSESENSGCVFFLDSGIGRDIKTEEYEGEDLQGWLVPSELKSAFLSDFISFKPLEKWDDYYSFALWDLVGAELKIRFKQLRCFLDNS